MNQAKKKLILFAFTACLSCTDNSINQQSKDCPIPPPEAIFKKDVKGISNHTFERTGRNSEESMEFADSTSVSIFQSGCDKITQEYRFSIPSSSRQINHSALAVDRLSYMSQLGPDYMTFGGWAQAIDGLQEEFAQNNTVQVKPGFFVSLDKLDSSDRSTLIIKLFQK